MAAIKNISPSLANMKSIPQKGLVNQRSITTKNNTTSQADSGVVFRVLVIGISICCCTASTTGSAKGVILSLNFSKVTGIINTPKR